MKTLTAGMSNMLAGGVVTLAECWKLQLRDGTWLRFTDHDADITVGSDVYVSAAAFQRSAIAMTEGLAVDNVDVQGFLSATGITGIDVLSGRLDLAYVEIFFADYATPANGTITMVAGFLGDVEL